MSENMHDKEVVDAFNTLRRHHPEWKHDLFALMYGGTLVRHTPDMVVKELVDCLKGYVCLFDPDECPENRREISEECHSCILVRMLQSFGCQNKGENVVSHKGDYNMVSKYYMSPEESNTVASMPSSEEEHAMFATANALISERHDKGDLVWMLYGIIKTLQEKITDLENDVEDRKQACTFCDIANSAEV